MAQEEISMSDPQKEATVILIAGEIIPISTSKTHSEQYKNYQM